MEESERRERESLKKNRPDPPEEEGGKESRVDIEAPGRMAMKLHPFYKGKVEVCLKAPVRSFDDFAIWYTPGVAEPCKAIKKHPLDVYIHTNRWNAIAVVSDGSRVLGLGNIGPEAGLPVMEGKSLLFKYLGGVDAFPLCIATEDPDEIITFVKWITPSVGGINLEDIAQPKCFYILDTLRRESEIPIWHDDQQGTATVVTAGLINALKLVGKKISEATIALIGSGASNIAAIRVLDAAGANPRNFFVTDSKGILHPGRTDIKEKYPEKWHVALTTNAEGREGGNTEALKDVDVCIAASKPGPGTLTKEQISQMNDDAIVFALANPVPEIWPWEAKEAGARVVSTGRSDFPNQVNNSLGFPGIFRGTLDVRATTITDEMCIAAASELAKTAEDKGLREDYIIPTMDEWEVFPREAVAVGMKAIEQGVARVKMSRQELYEQAEEIIRRARSQTKLLMEQEFIPVAPS